MTVAVSLSTMWAQQPRFERDMDAFAEVAKAAGYTHIEVSHSTDEPGLQTLMRQTVLPLSSLHAPTPRLRAENGRWNTDLNLASEAETERELAVQHTLRTIELAAECGAGSVVVHLGGVGSSGVRGDSALRRLYSAGTKSGPEVERERQAAHDERAMRAPTALAAARRSLAELAERAGPLGVQLGLECRMWYHEIPLPAEAAELLQEYEPAVAGYWHDVGHAEILDRIGLVPVGDWFKQLGDRLVGCHLHDMQGIVDHRAPGTGDVDWRYIAAAVQNVPVRTLEINQQQPEPTLASAIALLRREGVLPAQPPTPINGGLAGGAIRRTT
ncbi:MAG: sugar phosphate isomerase/epimerase family protein [Dehalococcoidia bacterium]